MTQFPSFLRALSATVRRLIAESKAVHVTDKTAEELDLLAGLPWSAAERAAAAINQDSSANAVARVEQPITHADIALGWLLTSRALIDRDMTGGEGRDYTVGAHEEDVMRAAECAELVVIAAGGGVDVRRDEASAYRINLSILHPVSAHSGTREGARAAWGFVVERLPQLKQHCDTREKYRRELEADREWLAQIEAGQSQHGGIGVRFWMRAAEIRRIDPRAGKTLVWTVWGQDDAIVVADSPEDIMDCLSGLTRP